MKLTRSWKVAAWGVVVAVVLFPSALHLRVTFKVIAQRGVLDRDVNYISKPYTPDGLAAKVRDVLAT